MAMGVSLGHVDADGLGLVTLVGLITIAASTYMITYSHSLYRVMEPVIRPFDRRGQAPREAEAQASAAGYDVVVFGLGRYGFALAANLESEGQRVLGVDFDPEAVRHARAHGLNAVFGDAGDPEFVAHLPLDRTRWAVGAVPGHDPGVTHEDPRHILVQTLKSLGFQGRIAAAAHTDDGAEALRRLGCDRVLRPFRDAAAQAAQLIRSGDAAEPETWPEPDVQKELAG
jgi:voltage-gated potassium channel Kch